jgi:membrane protease YdiL (CAAX protease family)
MPAFGRDRAAAYPGTVSEPDHIEPDHIGPDDIEPDDIEPDGVEPRPFAPDQTEPSPIVPVPPPPPAARPGVAEAPPGGRPVRWGFGDAAIGWLLAQVGGLVAFSLVVAVSGVDADSTEDLSLGWIAVAQVGLWAGLLGVPWFAARVKGNGLVRDFGLRFEARDSWVGTLVGLGTQFLLIPLIYLPIFTLFDVTSEELEEPARGLTDRATDPVGVILLVLIVGLAAPVIEEIFYRGLVFRSLENRFGVWPAIVGSAVMFGVSHFQGLQLPALTALGIVLAYLTHRTGRLGPAIVAHMAFNLVTVVFLVTS